MGLFSALGKIVGTKPPRVLPGAVLRLEDSQPLGATGRSFVYQWAYTMPGDDPDLVANQKRVGPPFSDVGKAQEYGDWLKGQGDFSYGPGAV